jgi:hypothetical protein
MGIDLASSIPENATETGENTDSKSLKPLFLFHLLAAFCRAGWVI